MPYKSYRVVAEAFWAKVAKGGPDECWPWTAACRDGGYGVFYVNAEIGHVPAHRYSYVLNVGPIPDGLQVCHRCDNPPCVNPAHLFTGTARDNALDKVAKGRARGGRVSRPGELNPVAKLRLTDVEELRRRRAEGWTYTVLAEHFGISRAQACRIANGKQWAQGSGGGGEEAAGSTGKEDDNARGVRPLPSTPPPPDTPRLAIS